MADVVRKQQTTALFLSTIVTHTRKHTELTKKKLTNLMGILCCTKEHSVFRAVFLSSETAQFELEFMGLFRGTKLTMRRFLAFIFSVLLKRNSEHNSKPAFIVHRFLVLEIPRSYSCIV